LERQLESWYRTAKSAEWTSLEDVRQAYRKADGVPATGGRVFTVLNMLGNSFRLITEINYKRQKVYLRHVLTHAEYDKGDWKK